MSQIYIVPLPAVDEVPPFQIALNEERRSALMRWRQLTVVMEDPYFELIAEDFVDILATFRRLLRAGYFMDRGIVALMEHLRASAGGSSPTDE